MKKVVPLLLFSCLLSILTGQASEAPGIHVLSIGPTYKDLSYTSKDAIDFARLFEEPQYFYDKVLVTKLTGSGATGKSLRNQLECAAISYVKGEIRQQDLFILFLSAHGDLVSNRFCVVGSDYSVDNPETYLPIEDIFSILKPLQCKKMLILDACHSGEAISAYMDTKYSGEKGVKNELIYKKALELFNDTPPGWMILTSSGAESSRELPELKNGSLTVALKEAIGEGKADYNHNSNISIWELFTYVNSRVPDLNRQYNYPEQHPKIYNALSNDLEFLNVPKNQENTAGMNLFLKAADERYRKGEYEDAKLFYEEYVLLASEPCKLAKAHFRLAFCMKRSNQHEDAVRHYEMSVAQNCKDAYGTEALRHLVALHINKGECEGAFGAFNQLEPKLEVVAKKELLLKMLKYTECYYLDSTLFYYANLLAELPNTTQKEKATAYLHLGHFYRQNNQIDKALEAYEKVMNKTSEAEAAEACYRIAECHYLTNDYEMSKMFCKISGKDYLNFSQWLEKANLLLGQNYFKEGNFDMAEATWQSIVITSHDEQTIQMAKEGLNKLK